MTYEKRPVTADSPADDIGTSCRAVAMGTSADEGNRVDRSDCCRRRVQLAIAGVSLALVLGSAGYFALSPDVMPVDSGTSTVQRSSNEDGGDPDADSIESVFVTPAADPVEVLSEDSGGQSSGTSGGDESKTQIGGSDSEGPGSSASSSAGSSASSSNGFIGNSDGAFPQQGAGGQVDKPDAGVQKPDSKTVSVSISVDSSSVGSPVSASATFTFEEGATVYDALCALGLSIGSQDSVHGVYVSSINGLAEKDHGASSGWMYAVNGRLPNMACSSYKLNDGDSIQWRYVTGQ